MFSIAEAVPVASHSPAPVKGLDCGNLLIHQLLQHWGVAITCLWLEEPRLSRLGFLWHSSFDCKCTILLCTVPSSPFDELTGDSPESQAAATFESGNCCNYACICQRNPKWQAIFRFLCVFCIIHTIHVSLATRSRHLSAENGKMHQKSLGLLDEVHGNLTKSELCGTAD